MKYLAILLLLSGCATGVARYEYTHDYGDGEVIRAKVVSPNEAGKVTFSVDVLPDGSKALTVDIDNLTKLDNSAEILKSVNGITSDLRVIATAPVNQ